MGQQNSKDELVYQQVIEGNVDSIKDLSTQGARLEWIDKEGKTPLIVASMDHRLYTVAKTLIELGANVNSYRPGRHAGTPLHHAAKRGLDTTVKLLLAHGANPFLRNDDCQTPLDVARVKGHSPVVRAIENHVSYFSGDVREIMVVPGILEPLVPQRLSRKRSKKCWVVVVPCNLPNPNKPPKLELAVYNTPQDPQPHTVIALWKCQIAEPKFQELDPVLVIINESTGTRYKFLSAIEGDRRQLTQLYSACKGFPEVARPPAPQASDPRPSLPTDITNGWDDISTSSTTTHNGWGGSSSTSGPPPPPPTSKTGLTPTCGPPTTHEYNGWGGSSSTSGPPPPPTSKTGQTPMCGPPTTHEYNGWAPNPSPGPGPGPSTVPTEAAPSAPPLPDEGLVGPICYPEIDSTPVDLAGPAGHGKKPEGEGEGDGGGSCVICWDAPVEGACIPCGHMAGCMSCLTEIRTVKGECPVCRTKIAQVIRVYAV